jgi:hypothetical protein
MIIGPLPKFHGTRDILLGCAQYKWGVDDNSTEPDQTWDRFKAAVEPAYRGGKPWCSSPGHG